MQELQLLTLKTDEKEEVQLARFTNKKEQVMQELEVLALHLERKVELLLVLEMTETLQLA
jgi:hypothetical protein